MQRSKESGTRKEGEKKDQNAIVKPMSLQALEQRLLLDGAGASVFADAALVDITNSQVDDAVRELAAPRAINKAQQDHNAHVTQFDGAHLAADAAEVIFIDRAVPDIDALLSNIDPSVQVYFIDSNRDGIDQIKNVLTYYSEVDALHIISHGEKGSLNLGSSVVDTNSMINDYADQLSVIGNALSDHGDILIYGCDFSADAEGLAATALLSELTGADVAASNDTTGAAVLGGDWDLEHLTGPVAARSIQAYDWHGILTDLNDDSAVTGTNQSVLIDVLDNDLDAAGLFPSILQQPNNGTLSVEGNGSILYTPDAGFSGVDDFYYTTEPAPTLFADSDRFIITTDTVTALNVLANDTFRGTPSIAILSGATNGTLVINTDNTVDYTPAASYIGPDQFTYELTDITGTTTATVDLTVTPNPLSIHYFPPRIQGHSEGNNPIELTLNTASTTPVTVTVSVPGSATTPITRIITVYDGDETILIDQGFGEITSNAAFGTVENSGIKVVSDGSVYVAARQDGGNAQSFLASKGLNTLGNEFYAGGVNSERAWDNDGDGVAFLSVMATEDSTTVTIDRPVNATWAWGDGADIDSDGSITVILDTGETYTVRAAGGADDITGAHVVSDQPIAVSSGSNDYRSVSAGENAWDQLVPIGLVGNDYIIRTATSASEVVKVVATQDTTEVFLNSVSQGFIDRGEIWQNNFTVAENNTTFSITTTNPSYVFQQSGTVANRDENGLSQITPIEKNGLGVARFKAPVTGADYFLVTATSAVNTVAFYEIDSINDTSTIFSPAITTESVPGYAEFTLVSFSLPAHQDVIIRAGARMQIGQLASSRSGGGFSYVVGFEETAINAQDDSVFGVVDTPIDIFPLSNDTTASNTALSITSFGVPANGTVVQNTDGVLTYTPDSGFSGADSFEYTVVDGDGYASFATITLDIQPRPTARVIITVDKDGDLIPDVDDIDDDNDGILDINEAAADTDSDGVADRSDLDSDNDGISDLYESGASAALIAADINSDGTVSVAEAATANSGIADADGDGLMDIFDLNTGNISTVASVGTVPVDTDTDTTDDFLDLDSDNDSIADTIEARPTTGYIANDGNVTNNDADGDGVIDLFDTNDSTTADFGATHASFNAPNNHDGNGLPDYLDDDSDDDGKLDAAESGLAATTDATYADPDGGVTTTTPDLANENGDLSEVGFREINSAPDALDQTVTTGFETPLIITPRFNDSDPDGDALTITVIAGVTITPGIAQTIAVTNGSVVVAVDGTVTLTPDTGFSGDINISYTVADADLATDTATHTVTVENAPPAVIDPDPATGSPSIDPLDAENILVPAVDGVTVSIDLDDYLNDPNGDPLTITPDSLPAGASFNALTNELTFTPAVDNVGDTVISFAVTDGNGGSITPTVTIQPVNLIPDAIDQTVLTGFESAIDITPLFNDNDPDGDTLEVTAINGVTLIAGSTQTIAVTNGTITTATDGTITLTPDNGYSGDIDVPYVIRDIDGATDTAIHTVSVANAPPVVVDPDPTSGTPSIDALDAENILVPAVDGIPLTIDLDDYLSDANGDGLTITPGTLPSGATFNAATHELTFTPAVDNTGDTVVAFTVSDGHGGVITPTVTIQPVNPVPDALDETVNTGFESPIIITPLFNDTDSDGDTLSISSINGVALTSGTLQTIAVSNGSITIATNGTITLTPNTGFSGDIDIPYAITDADGATDTAVHTITVENAPPVVVDPDPAIGTPSIDPLDAENILVPAIDGTPVTIDLDDYLLDPNGDNLTITPGTLPFGASYNAATKELSFTPAVDNVGNTVIAFTVTDSNGATITPTVTFQPVNPLPDAVNETVLTGFETALEITPAFNDSDPDGDAIVTTAINGVTLTPGVAQTIAVANGNVAVATDGTITLIPAAGYSGDVNVPYEITDADGDSDTAVHTVTVENAPPVVVDPDPAANTPSIDPLDAENILVPAIDGTAITIDLDDYLTDPNGDTLSITPDSLPVGASFNASLNELTFTPAVDNTGETVVALTVTDGHGGSITPTVTVQPVNPAPDAQDQTVTTGFETPIIITPLSNDTDSDGDAITVAGINGIALTPGTAQTITVTDGSVAIANDGTITLTPDNGFSGDIDVPYIIVDADGDTDSAVHTVTVANAPPVVVDSDLTMGTPSIDPLNLENILVPAVDGALVTIDLDDYLTDPNGDALTITPGSLPVGASFNATNNGLTYTPAIDNAGDTVIPFTVTDSKGGTITPTVTIQPVNPPPDGMNETVNTGFESAIIITPLSNDNDPDGDALTLTAIAGVTLTTGTAQSIAVTNGTVTVATDGAITLTPDIGFSGDIDVPYTLTDADGDTDNAVHTVSVANAPPVVIDPDPAAGTPSIDPFDAGNILVPAVDGSAVTLDLDDYLNDPNGDTLTITPDSLPAGASFNAVTNELVFTPAVDNVGDTVIPFTVTDANGATLSPTVTIQAVNPLPDAINEIVTSPFDTPVIITPLLNDNDPDGDSLTITSINGVVVTSGVAQAISVSNGTVNIATDGTITLVPDTGFSGDVDVPYTITDSDGDTDGAIHTVTVGNAQPVIIDPDPTAGTPSIDPLDSHNILVPATDGMSVTLDLDDYLSDPNGDLLTITPDSLPTGASFNVATNELTFTPSIDNTGDTVIAFTVIDGVGGVINPTVTIQPVNPAPEANDEAVAAGFEIPVVITPLFNDTDPDGDTITIAGINGVALIPGSVQTIAVTNGSVSIAIDGTITLTPDTGFSGDIEVPYVIIDTDGSTDSGLHTVTIANAPPVIVDPDPVADTPFIDPLDADNILVPAIDGTAVTIDLDDYLLDPNGDALTITADSLPGSASFNAVSNELSFTPEVDNIGDTVIPFTVTDANGGTINPTVTIQPVNPAPNAVDETVSTDFETPIIITLLANDTDVDGDDIAVSTISGITLTPGIAQTIAVANGTVSVAIDGTTTLTPAAGYSGNIDVPYDIFDNDGDTDTAFHSVEIGNGSPVVTDPDLTADTPSIDPADAENILLPAVDGSPVTIDLDDYLSDPNGDSLTVTPDSLPTGATFSTLSNQLTFTPAADNIGDTSIAFTVTDGNGGVITPTVTIQPVNPLPDAIDETVLTGFEIPIAIMPLANDLDPDADPLTISVVGGVVLTPGIAQTIPVTNGSVVVAVDGSMSLTPDNGFSGDIVVPYTVADIDGGTDSADHIVTVANAPPLVTDSDPAAGTPFIDPLNAENILVPAVDGTPITIDLDDYVTDPNSDTLTITPDSLPAGASFSAATNELTFTPSVGNTGDTIIPFTVTDGQGGTINPTVTIQPVNPTPDALDETVFTGFESPIIITPLANDNDADGDTVSVTVIAGVAITPGSGQTIAIANGSVLVAVDGTITLTPDAGFSGDIQLAYTLVDADGATDSAVHTVTVSNAPPQTIDPDASPGTPFIDPINAENILVPAIDGTPVTIDLADYFTDPNGDPLGISTGSLPAGAVFDAITDQLTFTPSVDNAGDTVITLTITDGNGGTMSPTVTIQPVNPAPQAFDQAITTGFETAIVITPLDNDTDPDGDAIVVSEINGVTLTSGVVQTIGVSGGSVTIATDGTITVTPDAGFSGDIDVPYSIVDIDGDTHSAIHKVAVANALPVVTDPDSAAGTPSIDPLTTDNILVPAVDGMPVTINLNDYLTDPNGDTLTIAPDSLPANATFNALTNELTFTPSIDNIGDSVIAFTVTDGSGGVINPTVTIQPVNPAPDALDETVTTGFETPIIIAPASNDTDPDTDAITVTVINGVTLTPGFAQTIPVTNGTVTVAVDNSITVTPDTAFSGDIDIPYTISDGDGDTDSALHTVTVENATPTVTDPDLTAGTPAIDLLNADNIQVPAVDGVPVTIDLDDYLADPNGDLLTITPDSLPSGATFDTLTNQLTFTPGADNTGDTVISFTVSDGNGGTINPTVTFQPRNPVPDAIDDAVATGFETPVVITPLSNDSDPDGDLITVTEVAGVALTPGLAQNIAVTNATVVIATDGAISVIPDTGYSGDINIPYTITDIDGESDNAVHTVVTANAIPRVVDPDSAPGTPSIDPLNANNILVPAVDGFPVTINLNDYLTDPNGDLLTITPDSLPLGATFDALTNELTFTPSVANVGDTVIPLTVTDNNGGTINPTLTIQPVNPVPDAIDETVFSAYETPVIITPLGNDIDPDGDSITLTQINGVLLTPGTPQVIAAINGTVAIAIDGTITVTPDNGFSGFIDLSYAIEDSDGTTDTAIHSIIVGNTPPVLIDPDPVAGTPFIDPADTNNIVVPAVDGITVIIDLNDYLIDPNGDLLSIAPDSLPTGAAFDFLSNELTFTPAVDNAGDTVISFTVTDGNGGAITPTVTIKPVNPTPDAVNETVITDFAIPIDITPLFNDNDPDDDPLSITHINGDVLTPGVTQIIPVSNGTVVVAVDGFITVTPDSGFSGNIDVPYAVTDTDGATDTAIHTVTVGNATPTVIDSDPSADSPTIDPLNANNILVPAIDGTPVTIDLDDYINDPNGDFLTITADALPANAVYNAVTNELTFTPAVDNAGDTVIPLTVTDGKGGTINPTITVQPLNPVPNAVDSTNVTGFEVPVVITPLANDTDPDGDSLTITAIAGVLVTPGTVQTIDLTNGTLTIAIDGTITVTPDTGYSGELFVPYAITDTDGATDTATHTITVANAPPVLTDPDPGVGSPSIDPIDPLTLLVPAVDGIPLIVDLDDYLADPNGDSLIITPDSLPAGATFDVLTNQLTFIPSVDNTGDTAISFMVTDNNGSTINPVVIIQPVNPAPVALDETVTTSFGTPVVITPLLNDTDADADTLSVTAINGVALTQGVVQTIFVANGTVTVDTSGTIVVSPDAGFSGNIDVPYTMQDIDGASDSAVHTVSVANSIPEAIDPDPAFGTPFIDPLDAEHIIVPAIDGIAVMIDLDDYFTDANGDPLTITPTLLPDGVSFDQGTNQLLFIPPADNTGDVNIPLTVTDGNGGTISPRVTIQAVNPAPAAMDETVATSFQTPVNITPLSNDTDSDDDPLAMVSIAGVPLVTGSALTIPVANGTVIVAVDGTITLRPDAGFAGEIDVPYTIADIDGATGSATHTVTVGNAIPVITDTDSAAGTPFIDPSNAETILVPAVDGVPITLDLDDYLSDPNGDALTITPDSLPPGATFDPVTNQLTFTPTVDNTGNTVISFTVTDNSGGTIYPTLIFQPLNPAPDAVDEAETTSFQTTITIHPLANDIDHDGDDMLITKIAGVSVTAGVVQAVVVPNGILMLLADGTMTVTPDDGFSGYISIPYTITDSDGATDSAVHTVIVGNVPPVVTDPDPTPGTPFVNPLDAEDLVVPAVDGVLVIIDLNDYFIDPNGDPITITPSGLPAGVTFNSATNILSYFPPIDNHGDTIILFSVTDSNGSSISPTVTIQPLNQAPEAVDQTIHTDFETAVSVLPLSNDSDPDGDDYAITQIAGIILTPGIVQTIAVTNGTVDVSPDGIITVTPDSAFSGELFIPYLITDTDGSTDSAIISVIVANALPEVVDPDPTQGTPYIDPFDINNIVVPAIDGLPLIIDLDEYLNDPNGDPLTVTPGTLPPGASYNAVTNEVTFLPSVNNVGQTTLPFNVSDGQGGDITVTIQPVNPAPVAVDDTVNTPSDTAILITPLANDNDPDGDEIRISVVAGTSVTPGLAQAISVPGGTVRIESDGTITVMPTSGFAGEITIPYVVTDNDGATASAIITVIVENAAPEVVSLNNTPGEPSIDSFDPQNILVPALDGEPVTIDLDEYLSDSNGDKLTIGMGNLPARSDFDPATNRLTFLPAIDNRGDTVFPFTVTDEAGASITPTITIQPANPDPIANPDTVTTDYQTPTVVDFFANDSDPDNDTLGLFEPPELLIPTSGTLELIDDQWVFTPAPGYTGDAVIMYLLEDQDGGLSASTHTVSVSMPSPVGELELGEARGVANSFLAPVQKVEPSPIIDKPRTDYVASTSFESSVGRAIGNLSSLNGTSLSVDGAVLEAVNSLKNLHHTGIDQSSGDGQLSDALSSRLGVHNTAAQLDERYQESTGFSSGKGYRGTFSVDPTDECGRFFIDTIVSDGILSIIARSTIDPRRSSAVTGFSLTLADGSPPPAWILQVAEGEYRLDRSVELESVSLKVAAHRESGNSLVRFVEIDTLTGTIRERTQPSNFSPGFYEGLDKQENKTEIAATDI